MMRARVAIALLASALPAMAMAAAGGPDAFGYTWADLNEPGVTSTVPVPTSGPFPITLTDESVSPAIPFGFNFPYYGQNYPSFVISDNGWISLDPTTVNPTPMPQPIPAASAPNATIAWYWRDNAAPAFMQYYRFTGGLYILVRTSVAGTTSPFIQMYIVFYQSGAIKLFWQTTHLPASVVAGIESPLGDDGLMPWNQGAGSNGFVLTNNTVALFLPPPSLDCTGSTPINCNQTISSSSPGPPPVNVTGYLCGTGTYLGNERVFEFVNPSLADVTISLSNLGPINQDLFLLRESGCNEYQCIAGGSDVIVRNLLPAGTYYIVSDGLTAADNGTFDVTVSCAPKSAVLNCGDTVRGTTTGLSQWSIYPCENQTFDGPEFIYEIPFVGPGNVRVVLTPDPGATELDLMAMGVDNFNPPTSCTGWGDSALTLFNPPDGNHFVMVEGRTEGATLPGRGSYTIEVTCDVQLNCTSPAGDLECYVQTDGTTTGAVNNADQYSCTTDLMNGPEVVYNFYNDTVRTMSFLFTGPPDVIPMLVSGSCNEGACLDAAVGPGRLIVRDLPVGNHYVVIDGRNGASGDFSITPICDSIVDPPVGGPWVLNPGETVAETVNVLMNVCDFPRGDVLFAMDTTGSMGAPLANLPTTVTNIINELSALINDVEFGLVSFEDTPSTFTSCGFTSGYGGGADLPYRLQLPITNNLPAMFAAIAALRASGGGDAPESYLRVLGEMYLDEVNIGWRAGSTRIVIMIGDNEPHTCDLDACGRPRSSTGVEPGRDNTVGTADDLSMLPVMDELRTRGITPIFLVTGSFVPSLLQDWQCWTQLAGGEAYDTPGGSVPPTLVEDIRLLIESTALFCDVLEVVAEPGYESWIISASGPFLGVSLPATAPFNLVLGPPIGTPPGTYTFDIDITCDGGCSITHTVTIEVPCGVTAGLSPIDPICEGDDVILDASSSSSPNCPGGLEYQFRQGVTIVRPYDPSPTYGPVAPSTTTTYSVDVTCPTSPGCESTEDLTVTVHPYPVSNAGPDHSVCELQTVVLDASGSTDPGCPGGLLYEWRNGMVVVRPASPDPTWMPPTGTVGSTVYTVVVSCNATPSCPTSDDVLVEVRSCPLAVNYDWYRARRTLEPEVIEVSWATLTELGSTVFHVQRAPAPTGPWTTVGWAAATGSASTYSVPDTAATAERPFYRVLEFTNEGPGDLTPAFQLEQVPPSQPTGGGTRGRGTGRRGR